jgi:hypothetical protein
MWHLLILGVLEPRVPQNMNRLPLPCRWPYKLRPPPAPYYMQLILMIGQEGRGIPPSVNPKAEQPFFSMNGGPTAASM